MVVVGLGFNASTAVVNTCNEQLTASDMFGLNQK